MARYKVFSDTSDNSISDIADADLLSDDNYADSNIDIDAKAKSNSDENITGKSNDDLCKKNPVTNTEKLF